MNTINVYEQPLPGFGQRFDLDLGGRRTLAVVALDDGSRQLALRHDDEDTADVTIELVRDQAITVGALLLGARFSIDSSGSRPEPTDPVTVETITIPADAPAVGRAPLDVLQAFGDDAVVLAVIRDQTSDIVEPDPDLTVHAGDRVVVAVRRQRQPDVVRALTGV